MYPSSFILRMPTPNRAVARFGLRDMFILINGHFYIIVQVFIPSMPTPQSSSSPIGVKGCVHFLDGHFLCHSNFIFRMPPHKLSCCSIWIKGYVHLFDGYFYMAFFFFGKCRRRGTILSLRICFPRRLPHILKTCTVPTIFNKRTNAHLLKLCLFFQGMKIFQ